jgi:DNA replication and repair protein RecF
MINNLLLKNFRCFDTLDISLSSGINFFYGKNGSGKTSILESLYLCSSGKSFKSSNIKSLIQLDKDSFFIKSYDNERGYTLQISKRNNSSMAILLNNSKVTSSKLIKEFPVTAIHNNTFSFADASPDFRRKLLDRALFVSNDQFSETWFSFYRCLKQRNSILRGGTLKNIEPWDTKIADEGIKLNKYRADFFNLTLNELYNIIDKLDESKSINYLKNIDIAMYSGWPNDSPLLNIIADNRHQDLKRRSTTLGPHKADIKFLINNIDARQILSRGEQKLFSILWCCAQHEVLRKSFNIKASLIIDDIKSELDDSTFLVFLNLLKFLNNQVIFSCIDDHFSSKIEPNFREFKKFHMEQLR